ncbi:MAG: radical SAM family heme chaperone HemW [Magnetococcales bacterium]|nr:radical SAM family heme chaperone HemW [Magnetococcales bacterium]
MTAQVETALSCYVHIPFCVRKCPYCDFYSLPGFPVAESAYVTRLIAELRHRRQESLHDHRPLRSIFFGGGTPSVLHADSIAAILKALQEDWPLEPDCEITLEANPESCHPDKIAGWRMAGVNRVSLGIQALDDARLRQLGRPHDRTAALGALDALQRAGIPRINVDLIHGTPDHTLEAWRQELETILRWQVGHLSCYALTVEPETPFHRLAEQGRLCLPDEGQALELFRFTRDFLTERGYRGYEISNFARPGEACRHNLNYWEFGDYLGIGAGAHGKWSDPVDQSTWRSANPADIAFYMGQPFAALREISRGEAGLECLMMGLRLQQGMSLTRFAQVAGEAFEVSRKERLERLTGSGYLEIDEARNRVRVTAEGIQWLDEILEQL